MHRVVASSVIALCATSAPANKPAAPPVGPEPVNPDKRDAPKPKPEPVDPVRQRVIESQELRDAADLARAAYEKENRPGPPKTDAARKQHDAVVAAYRKAIDHDPVGENATYCRQRLAGALTYVGEFDAALRVLTDAVGIANAPQQEAEACFSAGLHCLQAMHKPADALAWFRRADGILARIEEPEMRAKWNAAIRENIARCERELKK